MKIFDEVRRRPLVIPALLAVIFMFIYSHFVPWITYQGEAAFTATIRHTERKLDGTVQYVLNTEDYGRILYNGSEGEDLYTGDRIYVEGSLFFPSSPSNPGEFDYAGYLKNKGIRGIIKPYEMCKTREGNTLMRVVKTLDDMFLRVRQFSLSSFEEDDKGIAAALFMGDTSLIDENTVRAFRLSNCSHLLAVSGTHFAGFLMILSEIFTKLHVKRSKAVPIYMVLCILIGMLTGWSESVTRACVMSILSVASRDYASGMSLAVIMLMVKDPYSCLSSGFQMSFAACLAIRLLGRSVEKKLLSVGIPKKLSDVITPVTAATIGMMPFWERTGYYFSFVHLVTQIMASLLATAACVFFLPCVLTGLPMSCSFIFRILRRLTALCSYVSFNSASATGLSPMLIFSLFLLIILMLGPETILKRILLKPAWVLLMISIGFTIGSYMTAPDVTIVFIDVGQGDSCLIMSRGRSILIDGGVEEEGQYSVSAVLDYYGIRSVDIAVATHMDQDHYGGLQYLDSVGRIDTLYTCYDINAGDIIELTPDLDLYCIWPYCIHDGGNEDSAVLRLEYDGFSVLYTGDIGFESEYELIRSGAVIDSDILKVGHHGSAYSTSSKFLEAVSPDTCIISVSEHNSYGHPSPQTLERINAYGSSIRRTDIEGAIIVQLGTVLNLSIVQLGTVLNWTIMQI